jgi:hypothetical protein
MFVCAGFALIPLFGQSAPAPEGLPPNTLVLPIPDDRVLVREFRPHSDPFARALPSLGDRKIARAPMPPKRRDARLVAVAIGATPHALLSLESGTTQIVGVGDAIEGTRIVSIAADRVVFADGRRLTFSEK